MSTSASMPGAQVFGNEALGREVSFLDRLFDCFAQIPFVSDLAYKTCVYLKLDSDRFLAQLSMFYFFLIVFVIIPIVVKRSFHIWMVLTRSRTKGAGAGARFATFREIFQAYTIPSKFSLALSSYCFAFSVVFAMKLFGQFPWLSWIIISAFTALVGTLVLYLRDYQKKRLDAQPYPLGKYQGIHLYLTGGYRTSFIRGDIKERRESHLCVIGPSESGKTKNYFIPGAIEDAYNNCSVVIVEAKASAQEDMFELIAPTWTKAGKKVILFDPWDGKGVSFNPLMNIQASFKDPDTRDAIEAICDSIYRTYEEAKGTPDGNAVFHVDIERGLMKCFMTLALFKPAGQRNLAAVWELANGTVESVRQYVMRAINKSTSALDMSEDIRKAFLWFIDENNIGDYDKGKTLRGITNKLEIFSHPRVLPHVVNDELDLDMVFKEPTLLCIKSPLNVPGANMLASIINRLLMIRVPNKSRYGAGKDFKVFFYWDELPSLCIPKFDEFCKTARSAGVGIICGLQDWADIAEVIMAKLGIHSIDGLIGNVRTVILLPGLSYTTTKHFSDAFGKVEYKMRRTMRSTKNFEESTYVTARDEKLLMQPDDIKYLKARKDVSQCLIVDRNTRPFIAWTNPWYISSRYKKIVEENKNVEIKLYKKPTIPVEYQSPFTNIPLTDLEKVPKKDVDAAQFLPGGSNAPAGPPQQFERTSRQPTSNPAQSGSSRGRDVDRDTETILGHDETGMGTAFDGL